MSELGLSYMMRAAALLLALLLSGGTAQAAERRCGWMVNPTPGNHWLTDRDGTWTLATQGSEGAPGMEDMPDMTTRGWIRTNGNYGYGCACLDVDVDRKAMRVARLYRAEPLPLSRCQADRALPRPQ
jgi:hypothetical protein